MTRITGSHLIIESIDAEADRNFILDVCGFEAVDAGEGWLIFALPAAELAFHPGANDRHQLYLMCDDLEAVLDGLRRKGAEVSPAASEQPWGRVGWVQLPGGGRISIYEPCHPTPPRSAGKVDQ